MRWSCLAVARRLAEYHDGELSIDERVGVQAHLRTCPVCAAESDKLESLGDLLRASAAARAIDENDDLDGLASGVVSRLKAEDAESFPRTVERMFEDLHFVWAALGATAATVACIAITVGLLCFSYAARPDSLAATLESFANPGSNSNPVRIDERTLALPRPSYYESLVSLPDLTRDEEMWALNTTITREGRVTNVQLLSEDQSTAGRAAVIDLLDLAARSRFQPAYRGDTPIAVKMVWLLAHLTVRPKAAGEVHLLGHPAVV